MSKTRGEMLRFAVAGVAGLVVDVAVLYLALAAGLGFYAGRVVSFLSAVWVTWRINRRYTFRAAAGGSVWREWWAYLGMMLGGGAVNYIAYSAVMLLAGHLPVALAPLLPLAGVAIGSVAGMAVNFIGARRVLGARSAGNE
jgi:putative flippase GtrA